MSLYKKYRETSIKCSKEYYRKHKKGTPAHTEYKKLNQRKRRLMIKLTNSIKDIENPLIIVMRGKRIKTPFTSLDKSEDFITFMSWKEYIIKDDKYLDLIC